MGQNRSSTAGRPIRNRRNRRNRRGVTVVIVLAMISMTLALSYSIMRSQTTAVQIQANSSRRSFARDAAITGLTIALRKMHEPGWGGIGSTITGSVNSTDRYEARYEAGDAPTLDAQGLPADVEKYFEVKVFSTGFSSDPSNSNPATRHSASAVVRLIREKRTDRPSLLAEEYTVLQTSNQPFYVDPPSRIEGPIAVRGKLYVGDAYAWNEEARDRYLSDLHADRQHRYERAQLEFSLADGANWARLGDAGTSLRDNSYLRMVGSSRVHRVEITHYSNGKLDVRFSPPVTTATGLPKNGAAVEVYQWDSTADFRPLTGPANISSNTLTSGDRAFLENVVGLPLGTLAGSAPGNWLPVSNASTYRLFPGGPQYNSEQLSDRVDNRNLRPSATNPLGIFYRNGDLNVGSGVTLEGTLVVTGQLTLSGGNALLRSLDPNWKKLLKRYGESSTLELPVIVSGNNWRIQSTATGAIEGLAIVRGRLLVESRHQHSTMTIVGRVIADEIDLGPRYTGTSSSWDDGASFWATRYAAFLDHQQWEDPLTVRFNEWMLWYGLDFGVVRRGLLIKPSQQPVQYHWQAADKPVFVEAAQGTGLRWDVLEWKQDI